MCIFFISVACFSNGIVFFIQSVCEDFSSMIFQSAIIFPFTFISIITLTFFFLHWWALQIEIYACGFPVVSIAFVEIDGLAYVPLSQIYWLFLRPLTRLYSASLIHVQFSTSTSIFLTLYRYNKSQSRTV